LLDVNICKREIIGWINNEKFIFDRFNYRTARLNQADELRYKLAKGTSQNKNGQTQLFSDLPAFAHPKGIKPV